MARVHELTSPCNQNICPYKHKCRKASISNAFMLEMGKGEIYTHFVVIPYLPSHPDKKERRDPIQDICKIATFLTKKTLPKDFLKKRKLQLFIVPLSRKRGIIDSSSIFCRKYLKDLMDKYEPETILMMGGKVSGQLIKKSFKAAFIEDNHNYRGVRSQVCPDPYQIIGSEGAEMELALEASFKIFDNWWPYRHKQPKNVYTIVETESQFRELADKLIALPYETIVAIDYEAKTLGSTERSNELASVQFSWGYRKDQNYFVPLDHYESPFKHRFWVRMLKRIYRKFKGIWTTANNSYELKVTTRLIGAQLRNIMDVFAIWFQFAENRKECSGLTGKGGLGLMTLKALVYEYFGWRTLYKAEDLRSRGDGLLYTKPIEELAEYGCADSLATWAITHHFLNYAKEIGYYLDLKRLLKWYYNRTFKYLSLMYNTGFPVNLAWLNTLKNNENPITKKTEHILNNVLPNDKYIQKANALLTDTKEGGGRSGFLSKYADRSFIFKHTRPKHKRRLYLDVLGLEPIDFTDKPDPKQKQLNLPQGKYIEIFMCNIIKRYNENDNVITKRGNIKAKDIRKDDEILIN